MILNREARISKARRYLYFSPVVLILLLLAAAPSFMGTAMISLMTRILCFGLLAMSVDIAFGYTGLWSFGHAAIFGASAYINAILIKQTAVSSFWILAPVSIAAAAVVSAIFAAVAARSSGLYFLLITFALGQLVYSLAMQWKTITHGSDGLWGIPYPNIGIPLSNVSNYYFTLLVVILSGLLLRLFTKSPFGYSLVGIRENEIRARTMGYNTRLRKIIAFVISGMFAGLSGILYLHFNGGIAPENIGMGASGMAMFMVVIGGAATLWGGFVGSAVVLILQYYISLLTPQRWPIFLGAIVIAAVFFSRGGIFPRVIWLWQKVIKYGNTAS